MTKGNDSAFAADGLTKREYFTVMAMQGLLSNPIASNNPEDIARWSVEQADATIHELNKIFYKHENSTER